MANLSIISPSFSIQRMANLSILISPWRCRSRLMKMCNLLCRINSAQTTSDSSRCFSSCLHLYSTHSDKSTTVYEKYSQIKGGSVDLNKDDKTGIATITLNHPEKKNAISGKMMCDMKDIVTDLDKWERGKGIILHGAQRTFCSGGDLDFVKTIFSHEEGLEMATFFHEILTRLLKLPMISLAVIEGVAYGGGAELSTACDFRIMTGQAKLGFVQAKMGVITGWGGGTRLVKIVGKRTALKIISSAKVMDSHECRRVGLVDEIIPEGGSALPLSQKWLEQYVSLDASLVRRMKNIVTYAEDMDMESSLQRERLLFSQTWSGEIHSAAMSKNIKHS